MRKNQSTYRRQSHYIIQQEELSEATGYQSISRLIAHLEARNIWYGQGRGGRIYSTPAAFEALLADQGHTEEALFDGP